MLIRITNIVWETDGETVDLPTTVAINADDDADVADILSDRYGWLVKSYQHETPDIRERLVSVFGTDLVAEREQQMLKARVRSQATIEEAVHRHGGEYVTRVVRINGEIRLVDIPVALPKKASLPF